MADVDDQMAAIIFSRSFVVDSYWGSVMTCIEASVKGVIIEGKNLKLLEVCTKVREILIENLQNIHE